MMGWRVGFRAAQSRRNEPVQQLDDRRRCPAGVEIRFFTEHGCTDDIATEVSNRVVGIERSRSTVDRTLLPFVAALQRGGGEDAPAKVRRADPRTRVPDPIENVRVAIEMAEEWAVRLAAVDRAGPGVGNGHVTQGRVDAPKRALGTSEAGPGVFERLRD